MKKWIALLLCLAMLMTGCGEDAANTDKLENNSGETGSASKDLPSDPKELLLQAAEQTADEGKYSFSALMYGSYSESQPDGTNLSGVMSVEIHASVRRTNSRTQITGSYATAYDNEDTRTVRGFSMDTASEASVMGSLAERALILDGMIPAVASEAALNRYLPEDTGIQSDGDLRFVEFAMPYCDLNELESGEMSVDGGDRLVQLRLYVDADGYLCRMEMDYAPNPDARDILYTSHITYTGFDKNAADLDDAVSQKKESEAYTFPQPDDITLDPTLMKPSTFRVTTQTAVSNSARLSVGRYSTAAILSDGTVISTGEEDAGHEDVLQWENIRYVHAEGQGIYAIAEDGSLIRSGKDTNTTDAWDLTEFTDLVCVQQGTKTLYGLRSDGTVVATGENAGLVRGWKDVVQLSVAGDKDIILGLKADGTVLAAGRESILGAAQWTDIVQLSAGRYHAVGLKSDGTVVVVGNNPLNENTQGEFEVSDWTDIVYVSAGNQTTIALKADGTMVSTGYNSRNQHACWHDLVYVTQGDVGVIGLRADGRVYRTGGSNFRDGLNVGEWDLWD